MDCNNRLYSKQDVYKRQGNSNQSFPDGPSMDTVHAADYFYQRHLVYLCPLEETGGDDIPAKGRNPCENDNDIDRVQSVM